MMAESTTDIRVLATGLNNEVQDFLQKLFSQSRKRKEHKAVENVKYKLSPFCAMLVKSWDKLKPLLGHLEVYMKKFTLDDDKDIIITYLSDDQTNIREFQENVKRLYDENLKIVCEELQDPGSDKYLKGLLRTIHKKFKPLFAMILQNQHLFVELLNFDTEHQDFYKFIMQSEKDKYQGVAEIGKQGKTHLNANVNDINKTDWGNFISDDEDSNDKVGSGAALKQFQHQVSEDPIQTEIEVDPDTMEYIRLFCQEDLHGIAEEYGVVLDDTDAGAGIIKLMSFQGQPVPGVAMQKVKQYIQDTYYDLLNTRVNIASVSDKLQDKWKEIIKCGTAYKAWIVPPNLKHGDTDIFIMANKDVIDVVVDKVKHILGIAQKRERQLAQYRKSNIFLNADIKHCRVPTPSCDDKVRSGAMGKFQRHISEDLIQTSIEVDPDTMEYIRLFCQKDLHGIAEEYAVVLDDTDAGAGIIKLMSFQGQPVPGVAMQKVKQYIQDTYYDLLNTRVNIASVSDKLQDKWKEIIKCGTAYKAWIVPPNLKHGDTDIFIMANKDVIDVVVDKVKHILGIAPKIKEPERQLAQYSKSNVVPIEDVKHYRVPTHSHRGNTASREPFSLENLNPFSSEYNEMRQTLLTSLNRKYKTEIRKIQKIQNPSLYQKFQVHKTHMDQNNPESTANERYLWHGTEAETLVEINTSGFNRSFCGKNGTSYGKGVYFATHVSKAVSYAKRNPCGERYVYFCRVLTGEFTMGQRSYLVPPAKDSRRPNIKYDSVVDNTVNPSMFVVFHDTQAFPEYLITFF